MKIKAIERLRKWLVLKLYREGDVYGPTKIDDLEDIDIVVKEGFFFKGEETPCSTVGIKVKLRGTTYGDYIRFDRGTMDATDVSVACELVLRALLCTPGEGVRKEKPTDMVCPTCHGAGCIDGQHARRKRGGEESERK